MSKISRRGFLQVAGTAGGAVLAGGAAEELLGSRANDGARVGHQETVVGTWAASPQSPEAFPRFDDDLATAGFYNHSIRQVTRTSLGGEAVRLRFSNAYGDRRVTFDEVTVGISDGGAGVEPGTLTQVTFGGDTSVDIPVGGRVVSDRVSLSVDPEQDLATTMYISQPTGKATWHIQPKRTNYVAAGTNLTDDTGGDGFTQEPPRNFFLEGVEVINRRVEGAVVCFGDSITDGWGSTMDAMATYPHVLAERINDRGNPRKGVLNAGISGNRVLSDSPCWGQNALARFDRDVLTQPGVTDVILLEGINDIGFSEFIGTNCFSPPTDVSAGDLIDGMQTLVRRAHSHGVRVFGGTLTPFKGAVYYTQEGEQKRQRVNEFIRNSDVFDGVIDFDEALRDPNNPRRILSRYDSGDHLHPSDAGYEAMANAVDLNRLEARN